MVDSVNEALSGELITDRDQGTILRGFCCGPGLPRISSESRPRAHYTFCPVWEAAEQAERDERREASQRAFDAPEKPKLLGVDKEVEADLLGIDVEQVPDRPEFAPEMTTGVAAMEEIAEDPEWKENE